jgi:hypothetical protein
MMGGTSYFWFDPRQKIVAAAMGDSWWQAQPLGWRFKTDDIETVAQRAFKEATKKKKPKKFTNAQAGIKKRKATDAKTGETKKMRTE